MAKEVFDAPVEVTPEEKRKKTVDEQSSIELNPPLNPVTKSYHTKEPVTGGSAHPEGKPAPDAVETPEDKSEKKAAEKK
jgi:hypothetical protein